MRHQVQRHELRLHVGGESPGTRWCESPGLERGAAAAARGRRRPPARTAHAGSRSLSITHRGGRRGHCASTTSPPVAATAHRNVPGFDAVGHHAVVQPCSCSDALDADVAGAVASDQARPWRSASRPGRKFGPLRGVFQHRLALGQRSGHQKFSVPVTVTMSVVMRAPAGGSGRCGSGRSCSRARPRSRRPWPAGPDVLVHRARADGAAARQRHLRLAKARQQRPQHQHRGAHGLDQLVGRPGRSSARWRDQADRRVAMPARWPRPCCGCRRSMVLTSCKAARWQVHRLGREQRGAQLRQRGILAPRHQSPCPRYGPPRMSSWSIQKPEYQSTGLQRLSNKRQQLSNMFQSRIRPAGRPTRRA